MESENHSAPLQSLVLTMKCLEKHTYNLGASLVSYDGRRKKQLEEASPLRETTNRTKEVFQIHIRFSRAKQRETYMIIDQLIGR